MDEFDTREQNKLLEDQNSKRLQELKAVYEKYAHPDISEEDVKAIEDAFTPKNEQELHELFYGDPKTHPFYYPSIAFNFISCPNTGRERRKYDRETRDNLRNKRMQFLTRGANKRRKKKKKKVQLFKRLRNFSIGKIPETDLLFIEELPIDEEYTKIMDTLKYRNAFLNYYIKYHYGGLQPQYRMLSWKNHNYLLMEKFMRKPEPPEWIDGVLDAAQLWQEYSLWYHMHYPEYKDLVRLGDKASMIGWYVGSVGGFLTTPFTRIYYRIMIDHDLKYGFIKNSSYKTPIDCAYHIIKNEGFFSLWRGAHLNFLRYGFVMSVYARLYEMNTTMSPPLWDLQVYVLNSIHTALLMYAFVFPIDVLRFKYLVDYKTELKPTYEYSSFRNVLGQIFGRGGGYSLLDRYGELYKPFFATFGCYLTYTAAYFGFYNVLLHRCQEINIGSPPSYLGMFTMGLFSTTITKFLLFEIRRSHALQSLGIAKPFIAEPRSINLDAYTNRIPRIQNLCFSFVGSIPAAVMLSSYHYFFGSVDPIIDFAKDLKGRIFGVPLKQYITEEEYKELSGATMESRDALLDGAIEETDANSINPIVPNGRTDLSFAWKENHDDSEPFYIYYDFDKKKTVFVRNFNTEKTDIDAMEDHYVYSTLPSFQSFATTILRFFNKFVPSPNNLKEYQHRMELTAERDFEEFKKAETLRYAQELADKTYYQKEM